MIKRITHIGNFLIIEDNDDGNDITTYINGEKVISMEFGRSVVSILCESDVEYEWHISSADKVLLCAELHQTLKYNAAVLQKYLKNYERK